ncbi:MULTISPECIES: Bug family tripartite tricarboxylate transporter substrate binding protein [Brevibacterium]|uniref:Putative tricarboxylic transport membrane protein n=2 Tax=Brevibacterium linens TaxID=1703 RepID=A0A2H1JLK2_BRELN|nr:MULTISPECIES: tripartite tricarboxylate transporter substrate-binding protein [Brevibacterium]AZT99724.1 tripartite tricarboxylate transporter substrate binding protein [Brevibacterium linens]KAB1947957.1 tripartite tricarboxylate transporter substrate binding protein [Brevibacterium linens ATCC 9172]SMX85159.1 putative tricarboxylic transport membrane protein [Brevibacterium linens ATCC 9172]SMX88313.1 putative tricarboxylic transport membrane protein [Brevibacterium linens]
MPQAPPPEDSTVESSHPSRRTFGRIAYGAIALAAIGTATTYSVRAASAKGDLSSNLTLIAPAGAGGGWDGFARETQQAMRVDRLANNAQVVNIPGAGGTIGLGKFSTMHGRADTILATGTAMVGGIALNESPVGFDNTTLMARVAEDYDVLIAAADSPHNTLDDVIGAWKKDPQGFVWTGGSAGSVDHLTIAQLALLGGIAASDITYIPKSGGGEAIQTLLSGTTDFASCGFNEVSDQIEAGRVKAIGVAAPKRIEGFDEVPTMSEQGYEVTLTNWRGWLGAPDITGEESGQLLDILQKTRDSAAWKDALERNKWTDVWLTGDEFAEFIKEDSSRVEKLLKELGL